MSYKIVTVDRPQHVFYQSVTLDLTRITAILFRQSRRGGDKLHIESRMLQESLIPFVKAARNEDDLSHIHIFDEGSGVSGTKGFDKRKKLRSMMEEVTAGIIGDIVCARPDRLFRDKHFSNVSTFTELAERMKVKVIVPTERGVNVYDFSDYNSLKAFQEEMQQAYAYIETHIRYMNRTRAFKVSKGYYGGWNIPLPYVLLRDMPKEEQVQVIYEPWRDSALDLFKKYTEFHFETGRIARYVEDKQYLFPFMPLEHAEEYMVRTAMSKGNGGYTFARMQTLRAYLSNLSLAGFARGGKDKQTGETILIPNAFEVAVPLDLLEPCFASITGEYLDGTPFVKNGGRRQYRGGTVEIDAILHGLLTSDEAEINVLANAPEDYPVYNLRTFVGIGRTESLWVLPARSIDKVVLDRLIAIAEYDEGMVERVRQFFKEARKEGESSLIVLDTAIKNTQDAIQRVGRTIVNLTKGLVDDKGQPIELAENDPNIVEQRNLYMQLRRLQKQRDDAGRQAKEDPSTSISNFYYVLSHLRSEFMKQSPQTKKDMMRKLIEEVTIKAISPHLFTLHITWIHPLATERDDVALLWRSTPIRSDTTHTWTEEEDEMLRLLYPLSSQVEIMAGIPNKTPGMIRNRAWHLGVRRQRNMWEEERFFWTVMYADLQAVEAFTQTDKERRLMWEQINNLAKHTNKNNGNISPLWFFPVDMVSFAKKLCVTDVIQEGLSGSLGECR